MKTISIALTILFWLLLIHVGIKLSKIRKTLIGFERKYGGDESASNELDEKIEELRKRAVGDTYNDLEHELSETCKECFSAASSKYINCESSREKWCVFEECEHYDNR